MLKCGEVIWLSHTYFFADDNILFGDASMEGAMAIKAIINEYEVVSGQLINLEKSVIYFSNNVSKLKKDP